MKILQKYHVEYYVAPYEADAQLAYLSYIGYASDSTIMLEMYRSNSNWSKRDMIIENLKISLIKSPI